MKSYGISDDDEDKKKILYLLGWILTDIPGYSYVFLNTNNIKFKDWMIDVMMGYKIINYYGECSIFIKRSKKYVNTENNISIITENLGSSQSSSWNSSSVLIEYAANKSY